ncbi:hypothetical protein [Parafrankia sp. FMc2]|uniref:hypothetical protein n=1 Tax=Parafrankia sp. FMc2 TaxID=3233196 RepID=UPI0034D629D4
MREIATEDIYNHLTGGLNGDELTDPAGVETLAILEMSFKDDLIHAVVPDVHPRQVLGRFRVTVERVED